MNAPTCSTCGTVLSGFERSRELDAFVYFCPSCKEEEEARLRPRGDVAAVEVQREAA